MIEFPRVVLVGRHEPVPDGPESYFRDAAGAFEQAAHRAYFHRWPDRPELWDEWNVVAMVGEFGKWNLVELQNWEGLGTMVIPVLRARLAYIPATGRIDPVPVSGFDPPILHHATKLLPPDGRIPGDKISIVMRKSWMESVRTVEAQFERLGLFNYPTSGTLRGWQRLLAREGLRVEEGGRRPELVGRRAKESKEEAWA